MNFVRGVYLGVGSDASIEVGDSLEQQHSCLQSPAWLPGCIRLQYLLQAIRHVFDCSRQACRHAEDAHGQRAANAIKKPRLAANGNASSAPEQG